MTPEERLAAALGKHLHAYPESSLLNAARNILAADPTLAADLALAEAVRGFIETMDPDDVDANFQYFRGLRNDPDSWEVSSYGRVGNGPTLSDAVEKALR